MKDARRFYVYIVFRLNGVPCYVGKGSGHRWRVHLRGDKHRNPWLAKIINKARLPLPIVKIRDDLTEKEAFEIERVFILAIGRSPLGPLVNCSDGGEGPSGYCPSEESRKRRSDALRGVPKTLAHAAAISAGKRGICTISNEQKQRLRERMLGSKLSDETKQKISLGNRGKIISDAQKAKYAATRRGHIVTEETREKIRQSKLGCVVSRETVAKIVAKNTGKKRSEAFRQLMREMAIVREAKRRGIPRSPEHCAKISAALKGVPCPQRGRSGVPRFDLRGKKRVFTEAHKAAIREALARKKASNG